MSRVGGTLSAQTTSDDHTDVDKQIELEASNSIKYRTCSWQKTAALLFSEYIFPGIIVTVAVAATVLYTSLVLWEFCMRHPEVRDVCDVGQMLYWNWRWVWYFTAVMFLLNNTFIQGLHVLIGAEYLNTMTNGAVCTVGYSAITAVIAFFCSLPRTFDTLSKLATASAFFTFISVLLASIFAGIEDHPEGYNTPGGGKTGLLTGEPIVLTVAKSGTPFVQGMLAFLNISYTFIGQITLPSFIAEMKEPKDFPKALWAVTIAEIILFSVSGGVIYAYTGTQYNTAPAFGSLGNALYKKVSFSFMIPTLIFLGVLYASVSARFLFFRIFEGTRHKGSHTVVGWASWAGILAVTWIFAFIVAEVIPFFNDLLALMSSLFDCWFGYVFWGTAYFRMRSADYGPGFMTRRGFRGIAGAVTNVFIIGIGIYMLSAGTYSTVQSIIDSYAAGTVKGVFTSPALRRYNSTAPTPPTPSPNADDASLPSGQLRHTDLHALHVQKGGKMVPFGGYSMPVQYSDLSVSESHKWTRSEGKCSLFDVGHMVQHHFSGVGAAGFLERVTPSALTGLAQNTSTLSCLLLEYTGGIVDDCVVTRLGPELFYVVTNAGCRDKDLTYLKEQLAVWRGEGAGIGGGGKVMGAKGVGEVKWVIRDGWGLVALQGPGSKTVLGDVLQKLGREGEAAGLEELYFGQCLGIDVGGLWEDVTPVEGGLGWVVAKERRGTGGFHGHETISRQLRPVKEGGGVEKRRVGLVVEGAPAREGADVLGEGGEVVGSVTSGCPSPSLGKNIAMAYVKTGSHKSGTKLRVKVRGKERQAEVVKMPFLPSKYWKKITGTAPA
ncbi:uncharacterized protein KY384_002228 [Bacidia gigantensis]|uniref:uncharacterized protein n=1 Tax=Bacidia gigantensis TaxID=2732470 RepID=UPI001D046D74|nr:uncharacterized protein KY384_002228 [Bacidia gigantensis]KAG8533445.1 hypothetical protein KY384_002228 [Bacidia gigantensis]